MPDPKLSAHLANSEKGHDGKVDPHLVAMVIGHLYIDVAMHGDKLKLGIGHDTIGIQCLSRFVEPDGFVRPPKGKI